MKDYKVIQKMNNLLKTESKLPHETTIDHDEAHILEYAISYFREECAALSYPAKSYCVAIIYAHLLEFYFKENFFEALNDSDLLHSNDDFFLPYSGSKKIYDQILAELNYSADSFKLNLQLSQVRATFDYFAEEFSVESDRYIGQY